MKKINTSKIVYINDCTAFKWVLNSLTDRSRTMHLMLFWFRLGGLHNINESREGGLFFNAGKLRRLVIFSAVCRKSQKGLTGFIVTYRVSQSES